MIAAPRPERAAASAAPPKAANTPAAPESSAYASPATPDPGIQADPSTRIADAPPLSPASAPNTFARNAEGEDIESFARRRAQEASDRVARLRAQFGTPAIIAILAVVISALIAWRAPIVQHAPQMASFYAAIGLPVNLRELVFQHVKTATETRDGVPVLLVEGVITSTARTTVEVPPLRFALRNGNGQEIYSWTFKPDQTVLSPGAMLPFTSRLPSPPSEGRDVVVRFVNQRDATEGAR